MVLIPSGLILSITSCRLRLENRTVNKPTFMGALRLSALAPGEWTRLAGLALAEVEICFQAKEGINLSASVANVNCKMAGLRLRAAGFWGIIKLNREKVRLFYFSIDRWGNIR